MANHILSLILFGLLTTCLCKVIQNDEVIKMKRILPGIKINDYLKPREMLGFSYSNCGSATDPVKIISLSVSPDPLSLPGNVTVAASVSLANDVKAPLTANLGVFKKIFGEYIKIPCIDNVGSCTYKDVCSMLPPPSKSCPPFLQQHKLPCHCPISKGNYSLPSSVIPVKINKVPSGSYEVTVDLSSGGKRISCTKVKFSLK